jgi:hypothetical protein
MLYLALVIRKDTQMNLWQRLARALGNRKRTDDEYAFWLGEDVRVTDEARRLGK